LWGLMELIVRLTADREKPAAETTVADLDATAAIQAPSTGLKVKAAAAAVAIVMSIQGRSAALRSSRPVHGISAWQSAMRTTRLSQRNSSYNRKPRGNRS
jgi:hypothetical protein